VRWVCARCLRDTKKQYEDGRQLPENANLWAREMSTPEHPVLTQYEGTIYCLDHLPHVE
jgi:hypothetical protein